MRTLTPEASDSSFPVAVFIEDDKACRHMYQRVLEANGYHVVSRDRADGIVDLAASESAAAVIVDISLPGMSGVAACRLLKEDPRTRRIPVIVMSAHTSFDAVRQCTEAGADAYLTKPVKPTRVVEIVGRLTGKNG